jgi:hypothetical protein
VFYIVDEQLKLIAVQQHQLRKIQWVCALLILYLLTVCVCARCEFRTHLGHCQLPTLTTVEDKIAGPRLFAESQSIWMSQLPPKRLMHPPTTLNNASIYSLSINKVLLRIASISFINAATEK